MIEDSDDLPYEDSHNYIFQKGKGEVLSYSAQFMSCKYKKPGKKILDGNQRAPGTLHITQTPSAKAGGKKSPRVNQNLFHTLPHEDQGEIQLHNLEPCVAIHTLCIAEMCWQMDQEKWNILQH